MMKIKLIFTRKVLYLASKSEGFWNSEMAYWAKRGLVVEQGMIFRVFRLEQGQYIVSLFSAFRVRVYAEYLSLEFLKQGMYFS